MSIPRAVIVHNFTMVQQALHPSLPVTLLSAPTAAVYAGAGWWGALMAIARTHAPGWTGPDILNCGEAPGIALGALRAGQRMLILSAPARVWDDVAARATAGGAILLRTAPPALDLATDGALRRLESWLTGGA